MLKLSNLSGSCLSASHYLFADIKKVPLQDFECMPFNPMDNFPETFRRQICSINRAPLEYKELQRNNHPNVSRELEKRSSPLTTDTSVTHYRSMYFLNKNYIFSILMDRLAYFLCVLIWIIGLTTDKAISIHLIGGLDP